MVKTFGEFLDISESSEYLTIKFSPNRLSILDRWRNNGLSADFLSDYWATFFPSEGNTSHQKRLDLKNTIGYIANELLENAMKFHSETEGCLPIDITLHLQEGKLLFFVSNCVDKYVSESLEEYIHTLLHSDIEELYMQQLEKNARDPEHTTSRMGFLTMLHDYEATLAWRIQDVAATQEYRYITTMVQLGI